MRNSLSLVINENPQKEIIARHLAANYGLNLAKVQQNFWDNEDVRAPEIYYVAMDDAELKNFVPEEFGFKSNIDALDCWTNEEALRYLLGNIFCFK